MSTRPCLFQERTGGTRYCGLWHGWFQSAEDGGEAGWGPFPAAIVEGAYGRVYIVAASLVQFVDVDRLSNDEILGLLKTGATTPAADPDEGIPAGHQVCSACGGNGTAPKPVYEPRPETDF